MNVSKLFVITTLITHFDFKQYTINMNIASAKSSDALRRINELKIVPYVLHLM